MVNRNFVRGLPLILMPSIAEAHGEEVVFMPLGQLVAYIAVGMLLWWLPFRGVAVRFFAALCVAGVTVPFWFSTPGWFPSFIIGSISGFFLIGLAPPIVVALGIFFIQRMFLGTKNNHTADKR